MKFTRRNKYAVVRIDGQLPSDAVIALHTLQRLGLLSWGDRGAPDEHFVVKLRDVYAANALIAYSDSALADGDYETAEEVASLAERAGPNNPDCKKPD